MRLKRGLYKICTVLCVFVLSFAFVGINFNFNRPSYASAASSDTGFDESQMQEINVTGSDRTAENTGSTIWQDSDGIYYSDQAKSSIVGTIDANLPTESEDNWLDIVSHTYENGDTITLNEIINNTSVTLTSGAQVSLASVQEKYNALTLFTEDEGNFFVREGNNKDYSESTSLLDDSYYELSSEKDFVFLSAVMTMRGDSTTEYSYNGVYFRVNNKNFQLTENLDFAGHNFTPIVNTILNRTVEFNFDGDSHTISNIYIDQTADTYTNANSVTSIFGCWSQGSISNLTIENAVIKGNERATLLTNHTSSRYQASTTLTNVNAKNVRVEASYYVSAFVDLASSLTDCSLTNAYVILKSENTAHFNANATFRASGLGDIPLISNVNVSNVMVDISLLADNYATLTATRTFQLYASCGVLGEGNKTNVDVNGLTVENSKVKVVEEYKDSILDSSSYYRIVANVDIALAFNLPHSVSSTYSMQNIESTNNSLDVDVNYVPSEGANSHITFAGQNSLSGAVRVIHNNGDNGHVSRYAATGYITVDSVDISLDSNIESTSKFSSLSTYQQGHDLLYFIAGAIQFAGNGSYFNIENVNVNNCRFITNQNINIPDNTLTYSRQVSRLFGVGGSGLYSITGASNYTNCSFENNYISDNLTTNAGNMGFTSSTRNAELSGYYYVIGIGRFLNCSASNVCMNVNENFNSADSLATKSGGFNLVGLGSISGGDVTLTDTSVEDMTFIANVNKNYSDITVDGIAASTGRTSNTTKTFSNLTLSNVLADLMGATVYFSGVIRSSTSDNTIDCNISNIKVDRLKLNVDSKNTTNVAIVFYNINNGGPKFKDVTLTDIEISNMYLDINSEAGATEVRSHAYSNGAYTNYILDNTNAEPSRNWYIKTNSYANNAIFLSSQTVSNTTNVKNVKIENFKSEQRTTNGSKYYSMIEPGGSAATVIDNLDLYNVYNESFNTGNADSYTSGIAYGSFAGGYTIKNCDVDRTTFDITYKGSRTAYVCGIAYLNGTYNKNYYIDNCTVTNSSLYAHDLDGEFDKNTVYDSSEYLGGNKRTLGIVDAENGRINTTNCLVDNVELVSKSVKGSTFATGMQYNYTNNGGITEDYTQYFTDNAVRNSSIISETYYPNNGTVASYISRAIGMVYNNVSRDDGHSTFIADNLRSENNYIYATSMVGDVTSFGIIDDPNGTGETYVSNAYSIDNYIYAEYKTGGFNGDYTSYAYGIGGAYIDEFTNCVSSGEVVAKSIRNSRAIGIGATYGATAQQGSPTIPTKISNCYNYANVSGLSTSSTSRADVGGIGWAQYIDACSNFGRVTGRYVGGITPGNWHNTWDGYTTAIMHITNCLSAGDVVASEYGGTCYVGGLVGIINVPNKDTTTVKEYVFENNVIIAGVYSGVDSNGNYLQEVSTTTRLGLMFGSMTMQPAAGHSLNITAMRENNADYQAFLAEYSIKNNFMLAEADGKNANLLYNGSNNQIGYQTNFPSTQTVASIMGVYANTNVATADTEEFYRDWYARVSTIDGSNDYNLTTNKIINSNYNNETFALNSEYEDYANEHGWKTWTMSNNITPQVETDLDKKIIYFDLGNLIGETPSIILADIDESTGTFTFTLPSATLDEIGKTVAGWKLGVLSEDIGVVGQEITLNVADYGTMLTLYATEDYDTLYVVITDSSESSETFMINGEEVSTGEFKLTNSNLTIVSTYTGDGQITAITWQVKEKDSENYDSIVMIMTTSNDNNVLELDDYITNDFLATYLNADNQLIFRAVYTSTPVYTITFAIGNEDNYELSAIVNGASIVENGQVIEGGNVELTIAPFAFYQFDYMYVQAQDSEVQTITSATYTIYNVQSNYTVTVFVSKIEYSIDVNLQNLQNVSLPSDLTEMLIADYESLPTISIGESLPQIKAITNLAGYRFVGWKLIGMEAESFIPSTNGTIDENYAIDENDLNRYIINGKFNIIAVFQRQYLLTINMQNPNDSQNFASKFEIVYVDENGIEQHITNVSTQDIIESVYNEETGEYVDTVVGTETVYATTGNVMIDENTFVKVYITPNKRVDVANYDSIEFGANTAYVFMTDNQTLTFYFTVRSLDINTNVMSVEDIDSFDGSDEPLLYTSFNYTINKTTGETVTNATKIDIGDQLILGYSDDVLKFAEFRFLDLYLYNIATESYDKVNTIIVDDDFFDNYVDNNGQINILMKVIKQYKVVITEDNLVSSDGYELGDYTVEIYDGDQLLTDSERYTVNDLTYLVDTGLKVVFKPVVISDYAYFAGYNGLLDNETVTGTNASIIVDQTRTISLRFDKKVYSILPTISAQIGGTVNCTENFSLGDTIILSYTPNDNYKIRDWNFSGLSLDSLGAVREGNTVKFVATKDVMDMLSSLNYLVENELSLPSDIKTMMNPVILYGSIGGGVFILLLFVIVLILVLRTSKLKKARLEQEKKINDMMRKFNISDTIRDLKQGGRGGI